MDIQRNVNEDDLPTLTWDAFDEVHLVKAHSVFGVQIYWRTRLVPSRPRGSLLTGSRPPARQLLVTVEDPNDVETQRRVIAALRRHAEQPEDYWSFP